jgi:hypothetical protein
MLKAECQRLKDEIKGRRNFVIRHSPGSDLLSAA